MVYKARLYLLDGKFEDLPIPGEVDSLGQPQVPESITLGMKVFVLNKNIKAFEFFSYNEQIKRVNIYREDLH